ncbi:tetratricopeptide repeat protein [Nocardioides panacihumi]|uniref:tetratricopeptide repeat protein n=1 Tax=Nocardioides panacihumi TaxID=400774 RepID=UPI0031DD141B
MAEDRRSGRPAKAAGAGRGGSTRGGSSAGGKSTGQGRPTRRGTDGAPAAGSAKGSRDYSKGTDKRSGTGSAGRPPAKGGAPARGGADRQGSDRRSDDRKAAPRQGSDRRSDDRKAAPRQGADRRSDDRKAAPRQGADRRSDDRRSTGARGSEGRGPERKGPPRARQDRPVRSENAPRTSEQRAYDGPELPEWVTGKELDRSVAAQLKGLPEKLAARVARHLAAAGALIDSDPELAYQHAKAAKSRAQRLAVVREALGEAAYAAGHYSEALAELRAAKRMNGATAYLPIMADCHRALKQPEQAIKLAHSPSVANFAPEAKAEMTIVEAGARRDMGQFDAALRVLEQAPLMSKSRASWVVRLRYAYADTLETAGRQTDALTWFHRTFAIDSDELTDAAERAAALEVGRD